MPRRISRRPFRPGFRGNAGSSCKAGWSTHRLRWALLLIASWAALPAFSQTEPREATPHARIVVANLSSTPRTLVFGPSDKAGQPAQNPLELALGPNQSVALRFPRRGWTDESAPLCLWISDAQLTTTQPIIDYDLFCICEASGSSRAIVAVLPRQEGEQAAAEATDFAQILDANASSSHRGFTVSGIFDWPARGPIIASIPVAIYVDEEQTASPRFWVPRLQRRIAAANEIFRQTCGIEFEVRSSGVWNSDDSLSDLAEALADFEAKVDPPDAMLAIGYSSQMLKNVPAGHLGVSRGLLARHILIADLGSQLSEAEKLDILIHELGHYLGAVHVPLDHSVMFSKTRPDLIRGKGFRIGFDPLNSLILNCTAEEVLRGKRSRGEFSAQTLHVLKCAYDAIASLPQTDATARQTLDEIAATMRVPASRSAPSRHEDQQEDVPGVVTHRQDPDAIPRPQSFPPTIEAARWIVGQILADAGGAKVADESAIAASPRMPVPTDSDARFEWLVRRATAAAQTLPEDVRPHALPGFMIALGVLTDRTDTLLDQPVVGPVWRQVESRDERARRMALLGPSSIQGRQDWAQHFAVSVALVELVGSGPAKTLGLMKEWRDSQGRSGFSFADLAADYAGVRLADALKQNRLTLHDLEQGFRVTDFLPPLAEFPENLNSSDFQSRYGGLMGVEFSRMLDRIEDAIDAAPAWNPAREKDSK